VAVGQTKFRVAIPAWIQLERAFVNSKRWLKTVLLIVEGQSIIVVFAQTP